MPRVKEQWLERRRGGVLLRSTRVDRVALEANGVTTPLSRHGKVSSPPRRKLIPNPSGWTSTNNFGSPRLFRVTAFSFHRARTGLSSPLLYSRLPLAFTAYYPHQSLRPSLSLFRRPSHTFQPISWHAPRKIERIKSIISEVFQNANYPFPHLTN